MNSKTQDIVKTFSQNSFITKPKLRRISWHKLKSVRTRACALQESFYPTVEVPYVAVKTRMATLLGICDRMSVVAYLGRPKCASPSVMDQTVRYLKSGATVRKRHYFERKLKAKKGYIEFFGLGYVYIREDPGAASSEEHWLIHWNHDIPVVNEVVRASSTSEIDEELGKVSIGDFSLSYNTSKGSEQSTPNNQCELCRVENQRRERDTLCEREISIFCVKHGKMNGERLCVKNVKNEPSKRNLKGQWLKKGDFHG